uniref:DNA-3-methyladenine glycosylase II n=1 Tax=Aegilops tauschii subsp. strangulata TaxID=200361 RepID=A0A453PNZ5_AEGTS
MKPLRSIPAVQPQPPVPQLKPPRRRSPPAAGGPSPMTTPGAATPPSFKRSSPRKKQRPRSRLLAADFAAGEAEAARALVAARATPPAVSPHSPVGAALPREFFEVDALDLAPRLLGKLLRRDQVVLRITEVLVEAYRPNDSACHGRFGITARTAPVVSLDQEGMHMCIYAMDST